MRATGLRHVHHVGTLKPDLDRTSNSRVKGRGTRRRARGAGNVVLVDQQDGKVVRWQNLEEVWNHTNDPLAFEAFIDESWDEFKSASSR